MAPMHHSSMLKIMSWSVRLVVTKLASTPKMSMKHAFSFQCCRAVLFSACHWGADIISRTNNEKYYCRHIYYYYYYYYYYYVQPMITQIIFLCSARVVKLFTQATAVNNTCSSSPHWLMPFPTQLHGNRQQHLFSTNCQSGDLRQQQ